MEKLKSGVLYRLQKNSKTPLAYVQNMAVTHRNYPRIKENKNSKRKKTQEIW